MKEELVKRYEYLYENISYLLGNYLVETNKGLDLKVNDFFILTLEEFLFGDNKIEETILFKIICSIRRLIKVSKKIAKLEEENKKRDIFFKKKIDIERALKIIEEFLYNQEDTELNRSKKKVLDEYYRLLRYKNDGIVRYSGTRISNKDLHLYESIYSMNYNPSTKETGVKDNEFLVQINKLPRYDNDSIFTEEEKQEIYLRHHQELPWNFKLKCQQQEDVISVRFNCLDIDVEINISGCNEFVSIKEENIIFYRDKFYQVCPNCGSIIIIPNKFISEVIQERIKKRSFSEELKLLKFISTILNSRIKHEEKRIKLEKQ